MSTNQTTKLRTSTFSTDPQGSLKPAATGVMPTRQVRVALISFAGVTLADIAHALLGWRERYRQRRQLASFDQHMLRDLGLSNADVDQEIHKPFWRP